MAKPPLYPHVPGGDKNNEKKQARFQILLCEQSLQSLDDVKNKMWQIEDERTKKFGRTDILAVKADKIMRNVREIIKSVQELSDELEK